MRARPDVVVVGAGIVGLSIAYHLARRGASVTMVERSGVGAGASGVQPGGVRQQWGTRVNCVLARESLEFWHDVRERLSMRVDPGWRACGYLFLAHSTATLVRLRENVALQQSLGVPARILSPAEAAEAAPGLEVETVAGAAWCAEDGYFDRPQAVGEAVGALADGRVLASDLSGNSRARVREGIEELLPALVYVPLPLLVEGVYDVTPDHQAILGRVRENVWVAAGFSGHGFMLAPAVGRILADAIVEGRDDQALQILDAARFAQNRLVPEPQIV